MNPTWDGPILDNHFHVRHEGRFLEAIKAFADAGGTHVTLIPIPGDQAKRTKADWRVFFERHLDDVETIRRETSVGVLPAVGPYPVELHRMADSSSLDEAVGAFRPGYDAAHDLVVEGKAVAIGEVGRLHFDVPPEVQEAATQLLLYGMGRAKDAGCPIILHTEHATPDVMQELARLADRAGLARDRVVKHYAGPLVRDDECHGLVPSVIASKSNIAEAIGKGDRFLMETDYIDDPDRPDVVLPPHQVPKRTKALVAQGAADESLWRIHKEIPERLYGVTIDRADGAPS